PHGEAAGVVRGARHPHVRPRPQPRRHGAVPVQEEPGLRAHAAPLPLRPRACDGAAELQPVEPAHGVDARDVDEAAARRRARAVGPDDALPALTRRRQARGRASAARSRAVIATTCRAAASTSGTYASGGRDARMRSISDAPFPVATSTPRTPAAQPDS